MHVFIQLWGEYCQQMAGKRVAAIQMIKQSPVGSVIITCAITEASKGIFGSGSLVWALTGKKCW